MRKITILAIISLFYSFSLFSQTNELVAIDSTGVAQTSSPVNFQYCEIVGTTANLLGTKVNISIDFGQERKWAADMRLKDEAGKSIKFNSMIDALNFMGTLGWEFVQAYAVTMGNTNVYHFLLKKEVI